MELREEKKYNLPVVTAEIYQLSPKKYELRKGAYPDAPPCPFGHQFKWVAYDKEMMIYVRVTKTVFKRLINTLDKDFVEKHEALFEQKNEEE